MRTPNPWLFSLCVPCLVACAPEPSDGDAFDTSFTRDTSSTGDTSSPEDDIYVTFQQLRFASAWPAKKAADGTWERMCGTGTADGVITNVVLQSSPRSVPPDSDLDLSIRPLDRVQTIVVGNGLPNDIRTRVVDGGLPNDINLSNQAHMTLRLDCINPAPTTDAVDTCQGAPASASLERVRYAAHTADRSVGHNVMLLIDQSASISGLVQNGTYKEDRAPFIPPDFSSVASDRSNIRLAVATRFVRTLNAQDMPGVLAFNEQGLRVPCGPAVGDVPTDLQTCFGASDRAIWFDSSKGIPGLVEHTGGRSNLWLGVKTAYDFLRAKNDHLRSNHIVVVTDGPDTCAGEQRGGCQTPCVTADFAALSAQIDADHADPNAPKIHVHFVQFESVGYPGRDARQIELACVSGGHYQFIDSNQFPRAQSKFFQDALDYAVSTVRYALMGHWELSGAVPVYANHAGNGEGVPPGNLYALEGELTIKEGANLISSGARSFSLDAWGDIMGWPDDLRWDHRPTVRKPCAGFADCGASGAPGACEVACSAETLTCAKGASAATLPDLALCETGSGGDGFCCDGACQGSGSCSTCN